MTRSGALNQDFTKRVFWHVHPDTGHLLEQHRLLSDAGKAGVQVWVGFALDGLFIVLVITLDIVPDTRQGNYFMVIVCMMCRRRPCRTCGLPWSAEASYAEQAASEAAKVAGLAAATQATRAYVGAGGTADESGLGKDEAEVDTWHVSFWILLDVLVQKVECNGSKCAWCLLKPETAGKKEQQIW